MKALITLLFLVFTSLLSSAQKQINLEDIAKHVGDSVEVFGKVYGAKAVSGGKLLLINVGGAFPTQLLTIVLNEEMQNALEGPLKGTMEQIKVAGKVELYRTKPQIVIHSPAQVKSIIIEKSGAKE